MVLTTQLAQLVLTLDALKVGNCLLISQLSRKLLVSCSKLTKLIYLLFNLVISEDETLWCLSWNL